MKKILIVDDEATMRRNLGRLLRLEKFDVIEAGDGRAAVEIATREKPDLVLCDISMPELDGHGVLQALRQQPETVRIPFLFLSARGEHADVRAGMSLGADDYLIKPVGIAELLAAIEARFRRHAQHTAPVNRPAPTPERLQSLGLTPREAEVLFWVSQGKSNPDVGTLLDMKLPTVKKHLENIFVKLGVENRTAASALALEHLQKP